MGGKNSGQTTMLNTFCSKRKEPLHSNNQISLAVMINMEDLTHVHPILIIFQTKKSKMCSSMEDKGISPSLETTDKRSKALGFSRRLPNSSSNGTSTGEGSKSTKVKSGTAKQSDLEVKAMLEKGSISKVCHSKGEFLSSLFLISKKGGGNRPDINLKDLNRFIPYKHFKMEGLQKGDYMCKIDLKDAYFSVPLHKDS